MHPIQFGQSLSLEKACKSCHSGGDYAVLSANLLDELGRGDFYMEMLLRSKINL